jgi:hypothetical protein
MMIYRGYQTKKMWKKRSAGFGQKRFRSRTSISLVVFEILQCLIMLAAVACWFLYAVLVMENDAFATRFDAYDADSSAPARYFLPRRDTSGLNVSSIPAPGSKGRWALPSDGSGMDGMNLMVNRWDQLDYVNGIYSLLQGFVLILFFVKALYLISFQPRLSAIPGGFVRMLPDLIHLFVIAFICGLMLVMVWVIVYGHRVVQVSTFNHAMSSLALLIMVNIDETFAPAVKAGVWVHPPQRVVIYCTHVLSTFLFVWVRGTSRLLLSPLTSILP